MLALTVLLVHTAAADSEETGDDSRSQLDLAPDEMLYRDEPRAVARYPEHVRAYMDESGGLYLL